MLAHKKTIQQRTCKPGLDSDRARHRREEVTIVLRKENREEKMKLKRMAPSTPASASASTLTPISGEVKAGGSQLDSSMVLALQGEDQRQWPAAMEQCRRFLSKEQGPPINEVIAAGLVPRIIGCLSTEGKCNQRLQHDAAWCCTNIASGTSEHVTYLVECDVVPILLALLSDQLQERAERLEDLELSDQIMWCLGNIACDSYVFRDLLLRSGVMSVILNTLEKAALAEPSVARLSLMRNATWTISNLCRGKPRPDFSLVAPALPWLTNMLKCGLDLDEPALQDVARSLSYLTDEGQGENVRVAAAVDAGICKYMVQLITMVKSTKSLNAVKLIIASLDTLGNIITGNDEQTQAALDAGLLGVFQLLRSEKRSSIQKKLAWAISSVTAGSPRQIQAVIEQGLVDHLVDILKNASFDVKKEAAFAISNAITSGTKEQVAFFVARGCIPPLCELLSYHEPLVTVLILETLESVFHTYHTQYRMASSIRSLVEECGGLEQLEKLQTHENDEIYRLAVEILQTYFEVEEAPTTSLSLTSSSSSIAGPSVFSF